MSDAPAHTPRGVLHPAAGRAKYQFTLHEPPRDLAPFVEHYWHVRWRLRRGAPHLQANLPDPSVHVIFERGRSRVVGVRLGRFERRLEDDGSIFGIKFLPGGFHPFLQRPVISLTDRVVPVREVFGSGIDAFEESVLEPGGDRIEAASRFLRGRRPERDPRAERTARVVARIRADRGITRVRTLVRAVGGSARQLERLFERYVGVGPKWVIQRCRLHEALERIHGGTPPEWARLALDLGWYDQAHFIRDFRRLVGCSPAQYTRRSRA
jgi:AraC-like DNA-binding protein